jgi:phospholipid/cholesterol/gamma-HCH transport system ATP-binding protein
LISVSNLNLSFDNKSVLENINFTVKKTGITVVLGKNGSGKSVLLKCIAGLLPFEDGNIKIDNRPVSQMMYYESGDDYLTRAAYVFQKGGLFDSMTVYENIAFGMRRKKIDEATIHSTVIETLSKVGLDGAHDKLPSELSGGMQKRVGLARSLCLDPCVILYDDPTAGLDPVLTDAIADLVLDIREREKVTSVVVTHDLAFAQKIADNVLLLYGGTTVFNGSNSEFFNKSSEYARQFIEGDIEGPIDMF